MKKDKIITAKFEQLTQSSKGLIGGFSSSLGTKNVNHSWGNGSCPSPVNNCHGGNCTKGCGTV